MIPQRIRELVSSARQSLQRSRRRQRTQRPSLEQLEDRTLPSTFTVINLADSGAGSLRDAITQANADPGAQDDTINFAVSGTITLNSALPNVTRDLDIIGPGAANLTVQANSAAPAFTMFNNPTMGNDLDIYDLTLANSLNSAISNAGCLCVIDSVLSGNSASLGGAITSWGGMLTISNSIFSNNTAVAWGGAVYAADGTATISNSTFSGNSSSSSFGGAIYNFFDTMSIDSSTFSGNAAGSSGAGGAVYSAHSPLSIAASTFTGNVADFGGAIFIAGFAGDTLSVVNSTFTANHAFGQGGALYNGYFSFQGTISNSTIAGNYVDSTGQGGGIFVGSGTGSLVLYDTIVAGNTKGTGAGATFSDIEGLLSFPSLSAYDLIGDGSLSNLTNGVNGNIVGTAANPIDPRLGPLQDNGGPTQTMALLSGSPAIDAGSNANAPATDQRGLTRIVNGTIDIGAYEVQTTVNQPPTVAIAASANPNPVSGTSTNLSVLGADDGGESNLTYTWSEVGGPGRVTFGTNGSNAAKNDTATFAQAGAYTLRATITDAGGLSVTSDVGVTVNQTLSGISVTPGSVSLSSGGTQQFSASAADQFGNAMATSFTWSIDAGGIGGTVDGSGLYTAPAGSGLATVRATSGSASGTASVSVTAIANQPPTVATAASANPNPVSGTSTNLSVLGADDGGEANLTYTWSEVSGPDGATFGINSSNAAKNDTVTFIQAGAYTFRATITDAGGLSVTSDVGVTVNQTLSSISVLPVSVTLQSGASQQFSATVLDQFDDPMATQPGVTWSIDSGGSGTLDGSGLYSAPLTSGFATVRATGGGLSGTAAVTVVNNPPTVAVAASATPGTVNGTTTNLSVLGADDNGEAKLTYSWSLIGGSAPVFYSANGANAAKNTTVNFTQAGSYTFRATITDQGGLSVTSDVSVTVSQTLTSVVLTPASVTLGNSATQQFTATGRDQFGQTLAVQPGFAWSIDAGGIGGTITGGLYKAPGSGSGTATVRATATGISGTALVNVQAVPAAPTNLAATLIKSPFQVKLNWIDNATNEAGYKVYRSSDGGKTWTLVGTVGANATSFTDTSAGKHKTYQYRVVAYNDVGTSAFSNIVTVLT
jgi:hypothetical protein